MKQLGVIPLPPEIMESCPKQGTQHEVTRSITTLSGGAATQLQS